MDQVAEQPVNNVELEHQIPQPFDLNVPAVENDEMEDIGAGEGFVELNDFDNVMLEEDNQEMHVAANNLPKIALSFPNGSSHGSVGLIQPLPDLNEIPEQDVSNQEQFHIQNAQQGSEEVDQLVAFLPEDVQMDDLLSGNDSEEQQLLLCANQNPRGPLQVGRTFL